MTRPHDPVDRQRALAMVGATIAEPLRRAFNQHLDAHGCAERHGFAYCPDAMALFDLLPYWDSWGALVA